MTKGTIRRWAKVVFLLLVVALLWIGMYFILFIAVPAALAYFAWLYYKWHQLKSFGIIKRNDQIVQTDNQGKEISSIDLNKPYKVDVSFKSFLKPMYTIKQDRATVQFTSDTKNAKYIAVDVLGVTKEWPPVGPWNYGW